MCRWLVYSGSPVPLEAFLYQPEHSLIDQSLNAKLGTHTRAEAVARARALGLLAPSSLRGQATRPG